MDASDINLQSVKRIPYLFAAINEALRLFAPLPGSLRRITPPEGCIVSGIYIPGNTVVAVNSYAASHSTSNFHEPERFIPERWLSAEDLLSMSLNVNVAQFAGDMKRVVQPFGMGPRNCIGKNLAMAEMSMLVARLLWEFDIELQTESERWLDGMKVYTFYQRPPLMCRFKPANR
ncbi:hypothetical protein ONS95_003622 [Cadophora gregata]|uniref:uncharacterized protein n=1 Tax=Cadophora gregata TaxID=51156 RepID=UPI0026DB78A6|nr:uncharacterized protein ONS95_003622 [Cadophora gregata]KAK0106905.1 hypothetical protein ONS95_003622 [Cadophora gregata]KAK0116593.1 hypothetical protein ONS96_012450 [Cadophora gregata f. sp. sojae]